MVRIVTDSTADLSPELVARYDISVVPLYVSMNGHGYRDGLDIDADMLYRLVDKVGHLPNTSAPSVAELADVFDQHQESVFIGISSQFSSCVEHARLAADECARSGKDVQVVDSLNLSTGVGLQVIQAAELRDQGLSAGEIAEHLQSLPSRTHTSFVLETTDYLYKGGRCSAVENIVGSLLHIRPIIQVMPDGTMGVRAKVRGSRKKAFEVMLGDLKDDLDALDRSRVFVTHSGCTKDAEYLAQRVRDLAHPDEVLITRAGCVISSHCGPDTIGILYADK